MTSEPLETAGTVGIIMALIKLIEYIISAFTSKKDKTESINKFNKLNDIETKLDSLIQWQQKTDSNGIPLSYFPRNPSQIELESAAKLDRLATIAQYHQESFAKIASILEKISERQIWDKK